MRRIAELAAQIFTARDALLKDRPEDLRVAFLLFDSATETLMVRHINASLHFGVWNWAGHYRLPGEMPVPIDLNDFEQRGRTEATTGSTYVPWELSESQKSRIAREFESKLRVLAWDGKIPPEYVPVLGRLHDYRNEMYHREESRPGALRILVHLYAWLVADLLERLGQGVISYSSADPTDLTEHTYARMGISRDSDPREYLGVGSRMQKDMAQSLREGLELASAPELLAEYAAERIEALHQATRFAGDFIGDIQRVPNVTEMDVVRLIYNTRDPRRRVSEMRGDKAPVTRAMISRWDAWPELIRAAPRPVEAFRSLAEFESEFEAFESKVLELASDVDREIQFQIDRARGK
jgi:hypothetical protein